MGAGCSAAKRPPTAVVASADEGHPEAAEGKGTDDRPPQQPTAPASTGAAQAPAEPGASASASADAPPAQARPAAAAAGPAASASGPPIAAARASPEQAPSPSPKKASFKEEVLAELAQPAPARGGDGDSGRGAGGSRASTPTRRNQSGMRADDNMQAVYDVVSATAASAAEASKVLGEAMSSSLYRVVEHVAGRLTRVTVLQLKMLLGKALSQDVSMHAAMTPHEVSVCIQELGLRGESFLLSEVLGRHHGQLVTRQSLLAGLVGVAVGSYEDKVATLFIIFDESNDGRLQQAEVRNLFFACFAFKQPEAWTEGSGLEPQQLADECLSVLGDSEAERAHGVSLYEFFDFCKAYEHKLAPLLTLGSPAAASSASGRRWGGLHSPFHSNSPTRSPTRRGSPENSNHAANNHNSSSRSFGEHALAAGAAGASPRRAKTGGGAPTAAASAASPKDGASPSRALKATSLSTGPPPGQSRQRTGARAPLDPLEGGTSGGSGGGGGGAAVPSRSTIAGMGTIEMVGSTASRDDDELSGHLPDFESLELGGGRGREVGLQVALAHPGGGALGAADGGADDDVTVLSGFASTEISDSMELQSISKLGSGSFADVYRGEWLGTAVAIKRLKGTSRHAIDSKVLLALKREVHVLERVRHPNCIMLLGWCRAPLTVVTELYEGASISSQLRELNELASGLDDDGNPLGGAPYDLGSEGHARWALSIARDVARGMLYLHHLRIIHRDLKSANLLCDTPLGPGVRISRPQPGRVRIADFGLARAIQGTVGLDAAVGSIPWMAPEVMAAQERSRQPGADEAYGVQADVYSFAMVVWELCTCRTPYSASGPGQKALHPIAVFYRVSNEGMRPELPQGGVIVDAGFGRLMADCWAQEPDARPTFRQVLQRLDTIATTVARRSSVLDGSSSATLLSPARSPSARVSPSAQRRAMAGSGGASPMRASGRVNRLASL